MNLQYLHLIGVHLSGALPVLIQLWAHGQQNVLAGVQLRLFFVPTDSVANFLIIELNSCFESSHFVAR